jgi:hypothetical protein
MRFLGGKRGKINAAIGKDNGMSGFGKGSGGEADFSAVLLTKAWAASVEMTVLWFGLIEQATANATADPLRG